MESPNVRVKKSTLGKALYAEADFEAGVEIGIVEGEMINDPDYGSEYCIALDDQTSIEPAAPFRFLNHSCEPNCELLIWEFEDSGERQLSVHSIVPIKMGEELTIDYAWPADAAIHCLCGSKACRGWIVSKCELSDVEAAHT
jgi:uncharacterized protein